MDSIHNNKKEYSLKIPLLPIIIIVSLFISWILANILAMFISNTFWNGWSCSSIQNQLDLWHPYKEVFWGRALTLEGLLEKC